MLFAILTILSVSPGTFWIVFMAMFVPRCVSLLIITAIFNWSTLLLLQYFCIRSLMMYDGYLHSLSCFWTILVHSSRFCGSVKLKTLFTKFDATFNFYNHVSGLYSNRRDEKKTLFLNISKPVIVRPPKPRISGFVFQFSIFFTKTPTELDESGKSYSIKHDLSIFVSRISRKP